MNKYPLWKYLLILAIVVVGIVYALPNIYGEYPAVQISPTRTTKVDQGSLAIAENQLKQANISYVGAVLDDKGARIRFTDTETQIRARDLVQKALGEQYIVALNLLPATPGWLAALRAKPMYLGLDLRGGVHFLMQVDMAAVLKKAEESYVDDMRRVMREKKVQYLTVTRFDRGGIETRFRDAGERDKGRDILRKELPDLELVDADRS
ncbi:MAG TPA: protein translocase subunit SecD, partial [Burkholderiales bacterium]|nr:protein translocase subunit SecD [Burkholderiales bacterium]